MPKLTVTTVLPEAMSDATVEKESPTVKITMILYATLSGRYACGHPAKSTLDKHGLK